MASPCFLLRTDPPPPAEPLGVQLDYAGYWVIFGSRNAPWTGRFPTQAALNTSSTCSSGCSRSDRFKKQMLRRGGPREGTCHPQLMTYSDDLHWMESARMLMSCDLPTVPLKSTGRSAIDVLSTPDLQSHVICGITSIGFSNTSAGKSNGRYCKVIAKRLYLSSNRIFDTIFFSIINLWSDQKALTCHFISCCTSVSEGIISALSLYICYCIIKIFLWVRLFFDMSCCVSAYLGRGWRYCQLDT